MFRSGLVTEVQAESPDIEGAFRAMVKERIGALITEAVPAQESVSVNPKKDFAASERNNRLPGTPLGARMGERRWAYFLRGEPS